jgi:hypothetical protein
MGDILSEWLLKRRFGGNHEQVKKVIRWRYAMRTTGVPLSTIAMMSDPARQSITLQLYCGANGSARMLANAAPRQ